MKRPCSRSQSRRPTCRTAELASACARSLADGRQPQSSAWLAETAPGGRSAGAAPRLPGTAAAPRPPRPPYGPQGCTVWSRSFTVGRPGWGACARAPWAGLRTWLVCVRGWVAPWARLRAGLGHVRVRVARAGRGPPSGPAPSAAARPPCGPQGCGSRVPRGFDCSRFDFPAASCSSSLHGARRSGRGTHSAGSPGFGGPPGGLGTFYLEL